MSVRRTSVPASSKNYYPNRNAPIRVIVIHTGETSEGSTAAEGMGYWFAKPTTKASAHKGADTDSICTYVPDSATAWAAPGANADGLQLELAGRAGQAVSSWQDDASNKILANGALAAREWADKYSIPKRWLSDSELRGGTAKGFVTHVQVSRVFKRSSHWDPGPNFPSDHFMDLVKSNGGGNGPSTPPSPPTTKYYQPTGKMSVKEIQKAVGVTADGYYGSDTKVAVARMQKRLGVTADGLWGPTTEAAYKKAVTPTPPKRPSSDLAVDGIFGTATIKALQRKVGVRADGKFGHATKRGMQWWLGVSADGIVGPKTVRALQRKVNASPVDGIWGHGTTKALQRYLNK